MDIKGFAGRREFRLLHTYANEMHNCQCSEPDANAMSNVQSKDWEELLRLEYFHEGAIDTPLVLVHGPSPSEAQMLRDALPPLTFQTNQEIAINELSSVDAVDDVIVIAAAGPTDSGVIVTGSGRFQWMLQPSSWSRIIDLLEPFTRDSNSPRFQYLTADDAGDIEVIYSTDRGW